MQKIKKNAAKASGRKMELLAPAGNFEKLEIALHYGADAVYLGGKDFSLRNFSGNFTLEEMERAVSLAHRNRVRVYVTCNIYPRNEEWGAVRKYLKQLGDIGPDAVIVADPGVFMAARAEIPHIPLHVSTQANTTHIGGAQFWQKMGAKRVNMARELTLPEIREISENCSLEIEAFVHGAMCISYSGRCLISSFMTRRDSNRGMCSHPCRYHYSVMEEKRPGQYYPVLEDGRGTYLFNSRDLCMIDHIPAMMAAGIDSLKIEGRMKGVHYVATTVKVYREAIDACFENPEARQPDPAWMQELTRIGHRKYGTGFYLGDPDQIVPNYGRCSIETPFRFAGKILECLPDGNVRAGIRNKMETGDRVEILSASGPTKSCRIRAIFHENGESAALAQPNTVAVLDLNHVSCKPLDMIRLIQEAA